MAKVYKIALTLLFFGVLPSIASAANLYFSPSSGSHAVGATLSVSVYVSSADQAMNAASGVVSFPADKLEVTSLSKNGSIFTLWVQEPSFSNSAGSVSFEGIVLNPGFTGASGKVITINFRVKAAGTALLNFSSGSALANDGKGTNILASLGNAQFSLGGAVPIVPEIATPPAVSHAFSAPQISSPTHPDQTSWYTNRNPTFQWQLPPGATAVRLLYDNYSSSQPSVAYDSPIAEKSITDIKDGIWYFHVQIRDADGWGQTGHFTFHIDGTKPDLLKVEKEEGSATGTLAYFRVVGHDQLSGIDRYEFRREDGSALASEKAGESRYVVKDLPSGPHSVVAALFDKAGNKLESQPVAVSIPGIEPPRITDYTREARTNQEIFVKGTVAAHSLVTVTLESSTQQEERQNAVADAGGNFSLALPGATAGGQYFLWAKAATREGRESEPSAKEIVTVRSSLPSFAGLIPNAISVFIGFCLALLALRVPFLADFMPGAQRYLDMKICKDIEEKKSEQSRRRSLRLLRLLERAASARELTIEERRVLTELRKGNGDR